MKKKANKPQTATKLKGIESDNVYDDAGNVIRKTESGKKKIEKQIKATTNKKPK